MCESPIRVPVKCCQQKALTRVVSVFVAYHSKSALLRRLSHVLNVLKDARKDTRPIVERNLVLSSLTFCRRPANDTRAVRRLLLKQLPSWLRLALINLLSIIQRS